MSVQTDDQHAEQIEDGPPPDATEPTDPPDSEPAAPDSEDPTSEGDKPQEREPEDPAELLEPLVDEVQITIVDPRTDRDRSYTYTQKTLSYFGKIELYGILGRAVKIVMEGEGGLGLDDLMNMSKPKDMFDQILASRAGADDAPDAEDRKSEVDATQMLAAFARVVSVSPGLMKELYCVILGAKPGHYQWLTDWGLDTLEDKQGFEILERFIDQNWGAIEDFFGQELPRIAKRAVQARQRSSGDRSKR